MKTHWSDGDGRRSSWERSERPIHEASLLAKCVFECLLIKDVLRVRVCVCLRVRVCSAISDFFMGVHVTALGCSCQHFFINFLFFLWQQCFPWRPRGKHCTKLGKSSLINAGRVPRNLKLTGSEQATVPMQML